MQSGRLPDERDRDAVSSAADISYALYDARGQVVEVRDPSANQDVTSWHYDGLGREIAESLAGAPQHTSWQVWDAHGRPERRWRRGEFGVDELGYAYFSTGQLSSVSLTRAGKGTRTLQSFTSNLACGCPAL